MSTCAHQLARPIEIKLNGSLVGPFTSKAAYDSERTFQTTSRSCPDDNANLYSHQTQHHLALVNPTRQQELGALAPSTAILFSIQVDLWSHPRSSCADIQTVSCTAQLDPTQVTSPRFGPMVSQSHLFADHARSSHHSDYSLWKNHRRFRRHPAYFG